MTDSTILGLDISTSIIGWGITRKSNNCIFIENFGYIDVNKLVGTELDANMYKIFKKGEVVFPLLKEIIISHPITRVYVELPALNFKRGMSSIDTIVKSVSFNYFLCYKILTELKLPVFHISPDSARKRTFGTLPKSTNIKETCFYALLHDYPELEPLSKERKKTGLLKDFVLDTSDAIVVSMAGQKS